MKRTGNGLSLFGMHCLLLLPFYAFSKADSLAFVIGANFTAATNSYQPLWHTANRYASISDQKNDVSAFVSFSNQHNFKSKHKDPEDTTANRQHSKLYLKYGSSLVYNQHFRNICLQELFVKIGIGNFEIRGGRFKEIPGEVDKDLSSGSLGISGNAVPIPKVSFSTRGYQNIPFTNGWLQYNAQVSHGWLGTDRYTKNSWLHEKQLYLRVGKKRLSFFAGLQHYAEWAGSRDGVPYDRSWKDFFNVFLGKELKETGPSQTPGLLPNRSGDQRGVVEFGGAYRADKMLVHLYHQTPLENAQGVHLLNNRLLGISVSPSNNKAFVKKALLEFIYTNQSDDNYPALYRQSFYNNGVYKTGWEYQNKIIGAPLFINRVRAQHYFTDIYPFDWDAPSNTIAGSSNIYINNIIGLHAGLLFGNKKMAAKTLGTYTRNFIKNGAAYTQLYFLQEVAYTISHTGLKAIASVAADFGQLSKNAGLLFGLEWRPLGGN
ncbi:MAG: capsule assembly Wzi family protein [Bacteroidota bacterium]